MASINKVSTAATKSTRQAPPRPSITGTAAYKEIRGMASKVTVKFLGEDDSGEVSRTYFKKGPVAFTPKALADAMGFKGSFQTASNDFMFNVATKEDLQNFVDNQDDDEGTKAAEKIKGLLSRPGVQIATMVMKDRTAFSSPAFLVARFPDGSVVGLRGTVGGMTF